MKRTTGLILSIALLIALISTSIGFTTIAVNSIEFGTKNVKISIGRTYKLNVSFTPSNSTNKKLTFTSANKSIATVSPTGYITGIKPGNTVITVTSVSNKKAVAKCNVTILKLTTKGETLTFAFPLSVTHQIDRVNPKPPVIAELEKRTGVVMKFQTEGTFEGYDTVMKTRLAAGVNLPDIIQLPGEPMEYINGGTIIEIGGLMNKYAPNMKKWYDADKGAIKKLMTAPDKKIYTFPQIITAENGMAKNAYGSRYILVRRDWMNKFKLKDPKNLDEFYTLLKYFRDNDPNGNGKKDEIPYTSSYGCLGLEGLGYLFDCHLTGQTGGGFYWDKDGKVVYSWITKNFYELLKTAAKWYKEGLINPTPVQWNEWAQIQKALATGIGCFELTATAGPDFLNAEAKVGDPDAWYEPLSVMESIYGNKTAHPQAQASSGFWAVTKDCKNPQLAVKFLDYVSYSMEGIKLQWYGVEGVHYKMVNGKMELTDYIKNDKDGTYQVANDGGLKGSFPTVQLREVMFGEQASRGDRERQLALKNEKELAPFVIKPYPNLMATSDEAKKINNTMPDIITYRDEMVVKIFLGELNIDDVWDQYVSKIKSLGIDEIIKVKEAQLDRTN